MVKRFLGGEAFSTLVEGFLDCDAFQYFAMIVGGFPIW